MLGIRMEFRSGRRFVFDAERYETDLSVLVKRGEQTIPQVKVTIGPSIGDQGVSYHTFYSVAPEAVAFVNDQSNDIRQWELMATPAVRIDLY